MKNIYGLTQLILILSLCFTLELVISANLSIPISDLQTSEICQREALINHKRYVLTARWEKWGKDWEDYDWYQSCMENIKRTSPIIY